MKVLSTGLKNEELQVRVGLSISELELLLNRGLSASYGGNCGNCGDCAKCDDCGRCKCASDESPVARPGDVVGRPGKGGR